MGICDMIIWTRSLLQIIYFADITKCMDFERGNVSVHRVITPPFLRLFVSNNSYLKTVHTAHGQRSQWSH